MTWHLQNEIFSGIIHFRPVSKQLCCLMQGIPEGQWSDALHQAVSTLILSYGITVVVAAGNSRTDSCTIVPANVAQAITVAATDTSAKFGNEGAYEDLLYSWDNLGECISLFSPGVNIFSACGASSLSFRNPATLNFPSTAKTVFHTQGRIAARSCAKFLQRKPKCRSAYFIIMSSGMGSRPNHSY